ncbi:uncharacterized protein BDW70DRAFT_164267 [Aspergillus foveolatus]|uniref:uncharacterized protein n=1 Tax=Aspergillus foveolatus TaxID=210207 RepID=UPI003CCDEC6A
MSTIFGEVSATDDPSSTSLEPTQTTTTSNKPTETSTSRQTSFPTATSTSSSSEESIETLTDSDTSTSTTSASANSASPTAETDTTSAPTPTVPETTETDATAVVNPGMWIAAGLGQCLSCDKWLFDYELETSDKEDLPDPATGEEIFESRWLREDYRIVPNITNTEYFHRLFISLGYAARRLPLIKTISFDLCIDPISEFTFGSGGQFYRSWS